MGVESSRGNIETEIRDQKKPLQIESISIVKEY